MSGLQLVKSDTARVSDLPVAGCKFPAVFWGTVALDVVGLGFGPPCLRVDSEETLLTLIDERAQLARAAPGVIPVDSSEEGAPVRELIRLSVLGEPLVVNLQEPMPAENRLEYAIQATASVWEPLEQVHYVVSGDVDFDSFGMEPWDAGGMQGDSCQLRETLQTMMLQWLRRLLCRPVIMNGLDRTMRLNTENGLDGSMMTNSESPRLAVTPGEWCASEMIRVIRTDLRQTNGFTEMMGTMCDYTTAEVFTQIDSAVADCGADELDDFIFRHTSFPPDELSAGRDGNYTEDYSTVIDSAAVDYGAGAVGLDDLIFRRTSFLPDELSAGRDGDYIWLDLWTDLAVCARSVPGSLRFGHPHGLVHSCFCLTFFCLRCLESVDVSQDRHCRTMVVRITPDICCPRRTWCIEEYVVRSSIIVHDGESYRRSSDKSPILG